MGRVISKVLLLGVPVAGTAVACVVEASESGGRGGLLSPLERLEQLTAGMRRPLNDRTLIERLTAADKI